MECKACIELCSEGCRPCCVFSSCSMIERGVVEDLHNQLLSGDKEQQASAVVHIRDLCAEREEYRDQFASTIPHLSGLIDTTASAESLPLTHIAAQALGFLAESDPIRDIIR